MKSQTYRPGDQIGSLYELKPAMTCPVCNKSSKVTAQPQWNDQEGGELTTTTLILYAYASGGRLKRYSIDIFTNEIEAAIIDGEATIKIVSKHELPNEISVKLNYCGVYHIPHYLETIKLDIDRENSCVRNIVLSNYVLSTKNAERIVVVIADEKSTQLKTIDVSIGISRAIKLPSDFSVEKAAELIRTNRYLNFL